MKTNQRPQSGYRYIAHAQSGVKIQSAIRIVEEETGIPEDLIRATVTKKEITEAKHLVRYLLYEFTDIPLKIIAENTGIRNHSTVKSSYSKILNWKSIYKKKREQIERLEKSFQ